MSTGQVTTFDVPDPPAGGKHSGVLFTFSHETELTEGRFAGQASVLKGTALLFRFDTKAKLPRKVTVFHRGMDATLLMTNWLTSTSAATVEKLKEATSHVVVLGPTMEYRDIVPAMLARDYLPRRTASPSEFGAYARVKIIDDRLRDALKDIDYRSVADAICPAGDCKLTVGDNVPMQADQHHLTVEGATYVVQALKAGGLAFRKRTDSLSQVFVGEGD